MTQTALVKKLLPGGMAEVEVVRRGACMHDCEKCGGCDGMAPQVITVQAHNRAQAAVGDSVTIEGENRKLLGMAALVYAIPLVLFFVCYGLAKGVGAGDGLGAAVGGAGFVLGILYAIWHSRRLKARGSVAFTIVNKN